VARERHTDRLELATHDNRRYAVWATEVAGEGLIQAQILSY